MVWLLRLSVTSCHRDLADPLFSDLINLETIGSELHFVTHLWIEHHAFRNNREGELSGWILLLSLSSSYRLSLVVSLAAAGIVFLAILLRVWFLGSLRLGGSNPLDCHLLSTSVL